MTSSSVNLTDLPEARRWIGQFDYADKPAAELLLKLLHPVSLDEFERRIKEMVLAIAAQTTGKIAVLFVQKIQIRVASQQVDSSARLRHALSKWNKTYPSRICINPKPLTLKKRKIRHIVFVDDIVGTGTRFCKFWNNWIKTTAPISDTGKPFETTIRSWISLKYVKFWLVAYAAHPKGINQILSENPKLLAINIVSHLVPDELNDVAQICFNYVAKAGEKVGFAEGYGKLCCPLVFQHGCPNNAPAILWGKGTKGWKTLFPNRDIPTEFYRWFQQYDPSQRHTIVLKAAAQNKLAEAIARRGLGESEKRLKILTMLGLIARKKKISQISRAMMMSAAETNQLFQELVSCGLVGGAFKVTPFGFDVLERYRQGRNLNRNTPPPAQVIKRESYVPFK